MLELDVAIGLQTAEIADFGFLIELVEFALVPIDDVVGVHEVIEFEPGGRAVQSVRWSGGVKAEGGAGGGRVG